MGRDTHLILAATDRMASIYHSVNHYPRLLPEQITNSTDHTTDDELADAARVVLDHMNNQKVSDIRQLFETRTAQGVALSDLASAARADTFGAVAPCWSILIQPFRER